MISLLILNNTIVKKKNKNENVIKNNGVIIEESIEGELNFEILAG